MVPLIAEEDIKCWKALTEDRDSPYEHFYYEPGKLYTTEINDDEHDHPSCFDLIDQEYLDETYGHGEWRKKRDDLRVIAEGFHVAMNRERLEYSEYDIFEAIIPKGSEYFLGVTGLAVSNQIIVY
jgi:hypothetical protein